MPKSIKWTSVAYNSYLNFLSRLIQSDATVLAKKINVVLSKKLKVLKSYPFIGTLTSKRRARKLILTNNIFIIYSISENHITILAFIDARTNHNF